MERRSTGWHKAYTYILIGYALCILLFYWIAHEQLNYLTEVTSPVSAQTTIGVVNDGTTVLQPYIPLKTHVLELELYMGPNGRENGGITNLAMMDGETVLGEASLDNMQVTKDDWYSFFFSEPVQVKEGQEISLRVTASGVPEGQGITIFSGNGINTGRFTISTQSSSFLVNGQTMLGSLCLRATERVALTAGKVYWPVSGIVALLLAFYLIMLAKREREEKRSITLTTVMLIKQYRFLIGQLVSRDFKIKYKRSFLGVLWSFLNPILTMSVQYVVFSTLFKSNIENFPVYLMTGIVLFNFFTESVGLGLGSIVGNASLITKVYMPKYIYPVTRVMSSGINLVISLIPLLGMMVIMQVPFSKALLLMPLVLVFLMVFCIGMSLLLSTSMVFFRDTQFLWGILVMLWTFLTPIFYPESIIPAALIKFYHMNPMYQFIYFMRCITLGGISPGPITYLYCTLCAFVPLLLGLWAFKKNQDKFVFYL